jgi:hypothetical protein
MVPATGPANSTLPAAGARTVAPTGAEMSIPRCPGPYGPARASNPRTTAPVTGIHKPGTRGRSGTTVVVGRATTPSPFPMAAGAATGRAATVRSSTSKGSRQPRTGPR